jgi:hypothetical protein
MPPTQKTSAGFRRLAPWSFLAALCALTACMGTDAGNGPPAVDAGAAQVSQEKPAGRPGVPAGCTLEWSVAARDSVLNCPDVPPPSPR